MALAAIKINNFQDFSNFVKTVSALSGTDSYILMAKNGESYLVNNIINADQADLSHNIEFCTQEGKIYSIQKIKNLLENPIKNKKEILTHFNLNTRIQELIQATSEELEHYNNGDQKNEIDLWPILEKINFKAAKYKIDNKVILPSSVSVTGSAATNELENQISNILLDETKKLALKHATNSEFSSQIKTSINKRLNILKEIKQKLENTINNIVYPDKDEQILIDDKNKLKNNLRTIEAKRPYKRIIGLFTLGWFLTLLVGPGALAGAALFVTGLTLLPFAAPLILGVFLLACWIYALRVDSSLTDEQNKIQQEINALEPLLTTYTEIKISKEYINDLSSIDKEIHILSECLVQIDEHSKLSMKENDNKAEVESSRSPSLQLQAKV